MVSDIHVMEATCKAYVNNVRQMEPDDGTNHEWEGLEGEAARLVLAARSKREQLRANEQIDTEVSD